MPRLFATLFAVLICGAATCQARDIFVNNIGGDDRYDGSAEATTSQGGGPCRTIAKALRTADGGDRIILANTGLPYQESITLQAARHSGTKSFPFVIAGNGAVLDGSAPIPSEAWEHVQDDLFRFRPQFSQYHQLFREALPLTRKPTDSQFVPPKLEPLEWALVGRSVVVRTEDSRVPQSFDLWHSRLRVGITLYEVRNVVIYDLTVQGFQLDGINCHDSVFSAAFVGCTARGNGRSGVSVGGSSRVQLEECVMGNNGAAQIRTEGFCELDILNCDVYDNTAPELHRTGGKVTVRQTAPPEDAAPAETPAAE